MTEQLTTQNKYIILKFKQNVIPNGTFSQIFMKMEIQSKYAITYIKTNKATLLRVCCEMRKFI